MQKLDQPNVARLRNVFSIGLREVLVYEYLQCNLSKLIESRQDLVKDQMFRKNVLHQMLLGVKYFHEQGIIHEELRPEFVLVDMDRKTVKLAYFGEPEKVENGPYERGSLWYKAPEYVFGPRTFSTAFTVWSVGCIFGEMITGKPLFPGRHPLELGGYILRLLCPSNSESRSKSSASSEPRNWPNLDLKNDLIEDFPGVEPAGADLLSKMLSFYPEQRITVEDPLQHEYFNDVQA